uniref:Uncharacterized protein n=1 Tax=Arundo donax TaxID=35708 RepID=A0A0A9ACR5_ARUDO
MPAAVARCVHGRRGGRRGTRRRRHGLRLHEERWRRSRHLVCMRMPCTTRLQFVYVVS